MIINLCSEFPCLTYQSFCIDYKGRFGVTCLNIFCTGTLNANFSWLAVSVNNIFYSIFGWVKKCFKISCYFPVFVGWLHRQQLVSVLQTVLYRDKMIGLNQFFIVSRFHKWPCVSSKRVKFFLVLAFKTEKEMSNKSKKKKKQFIVGIGIFFLQIIFLSKLTILNYS